MLTIKQRVRAIRINVSLILALCCFTPEGFFVTGETRRRSRRCSTARTKESGHPGAEIIHLFP
ncbi:hypothetical protein BIV59_04890 [Bacillus sp. MUM 13]|nr:hypothetical protein BIV59_04890 [Bacillus sp. MUM 13]